MKVERSNVNFPIWRKKVDKTILKLGYTPIPSWVLKIWNIENQFHEILSKKDSRASIHIVFKTKDFNGFVSKSKRSSTGFFYRLYISADLCDELKKIYVMSYMRSIEEQLREAKSYKADIEKEIPFWEFLDIEYDASQKTFHFTPYYTQQLIFPELFTNLVKSTMLQQFDNVNEEYTIVKSDWLPKSTFVNQFNANNVIYYLLDTNKKLIYIGEAERLEGRFKSGHSVISEWDFYRYDILPKSFTKRQRVALERMLIACFASLLGKHVSPASIVISDYKLVNRKIDTVNMSSILI